MQLVTLMPGPLHKQIMASRQRLLNVAFELFD
jgi:hypothetical protein